jgi:tetratricopeptide (TPR) repeat protein
VADLWRVLGYDEKASEIGGAISENSELVVLEGPPGVGKTWLAQGIGTIWEEGGGSSVLAVGDRLNSAESLYPFGFAMGELPSLKSLGPALGSVAKAGETLLGTAGLITTTVETLAMARKSRRRERKWPLSDAEQDILHQLEQLSDKRPLLFIADNLHWWDAESLQFLQQLRDPRMSMAYPFLSEMRVLAVQTPDSYQPAVNPEALEILLRPSTTRRFQLPRVPRESFTEVLVAFGASPEVSDELTEAIWACSGGHLALARRCADHIAKGEVAALRAATASDDFLSRILEERVDALGEKGRQALSLLRTAAVLGLTFRRDELLCAFEGDRAETVGLLRYCREEAVLELDDNVGRFAHDLYREHFLKSGRDDLARIHESLSDCLRELRPGDYELRCQNAIKAEQFEEAAAWAVQAALLRQREGLPWRDLQEGVMDAMQKGSLVPVAERLEIALEHLNQYRFDECLQTLDSIPHNLPHCLVGEVAYLRASCLMTTRSEESRARARAILESWSGYEEEEPELGVRLMALLLHGYALQVDKAPGLELEGKIRQFLSRRASYDPAADDAAYILDRSAGALHVPDRALWMNRYAVEHFQPDEEQGVIRRPVEYYRCLINLGANALLNGEFQEAVDAHRKLDNLLSSYEPGVFPRLDYPLMNALLMDHRMGTVDIIEAVRRQREIVEEHRVTGDPFYVENALAVYLALAGSYQEAIEIFDRLLVELDRRHEPEESTLYLVRANRCATRLAEGHQGEAQTEWTRLTGLIKRLPYPIRPYMIRRHEMLREVIEVGEEMSALEFDQCLLADKRPEFGPFWNQLGRGFWLPEIEWWR